MAKGLVNWHLVSLRERVHKASEWFEVQSLSIIISASPGAETLHMAVFDASVLLGVGLDDKVYVFSDNVSGAGFVALGLENRFYALTCTPRDGKTYSVCRIRTLVIGVPAAALITSTGPLEALVSFNSTNRRQLLFCC